MTPPFTEAELAETRRPLLEATPAPAPRLRRRAGRRLGGRAPLPRRLGVRRPRAAARLARRVRHPPDRRREPAVRGRRRGSGPRLLQRLPPPRRAPRLRARGHDAPPPVPLPRLVLRLRRQPQAAPRTPARSRTSTPPPPASTAVRMEERHGLLFADVSGAAGPLDEHLGDLAPHLEHYRLGDARALRGDHLRRRSRTGRRSSRTTPSACTAPACTPSSTASSTT